MNLSKPQANAMKLQQEVKEKEALLEQCYVRMERGEAPDEEAEKTWMKMLRDEQRKKQEKIRNAEVTNSLLTSDEELHSKCRIIFWQ